MAEASAAGCKAARHEAEVDRVKETGDSLDQVERVMAIEEVLEEIHR